MNYDDILIEVEESCKDDNEVIINMYPDVPPNIIEEHWEDYVDGLESWF